MDVLPRHQQRCVESVLLGRIAVGAPFATLS